MIFQILLRPALIAIALFATDAQASNPAEPHVQELGYVTPQMFGADGRDTRDDTAALQASVDAAAASRRPVVIPAGTYFVNANVNPGWGAFGGVSLPSGTRLRFEQGAVLQALPSADVQYSVIRIEDVENVVVEGPGMIRGERHVHRGKDGEWGMGIFIYNASHVRVEDVSVEDCWGDGIYVGGSGHVYSEDIEIHRIKARGNRRQGISVVSARRVLIVDADIRDTHGTAPSAGIDLEPNDPNHPNEEITIRGGYFSGNAMDILLTWGNRDVTIDGPTLRSANGIIVRDGSRNVRILRADIHASGTAPGTAAIQVSADDPTTVHELEISRNNLRGGAVVLDVPYRQVRGVRVLKNQIRRDRQGQRSYRVEAAGAEWAGNRVRER